MACVCHCVPQRFADAFGLDRNAQMTKKEMVERISNYIKENLRKREDFPSIYILDNTTKMLFNVDDSVEVNVFNIRKFIADVFKNC